MRLFELAKQQINIADKPLSNLCSKIKQEEQKLQTATIKMNLSINLQKEREM